MASIENAVSSGRSAFRAAVAPVPIVGGALDYLLFDKSDEIRSRNVEQTMKAAIRAIGQAEATQRSGGGSGIEMSATARWIESIAETSQAGPRFWDGTMTLDEELDILVASGSCGESNCWGDSSYGVFETSLGPSAARLIDPVENMVVA